MYRHARRIAFLCAAVALASSSSAQAFSTPRPIRLGALKGPSGIGLARVFENPPWLPGGGRLKPVAVPGPDTMAAMLISGEVDAAVLPLNMAAKLRASGIPLVLAAIVGEGMLSLLTPDKALDSLAGLRGKELHIGGQGATPEYLMRRLLRDAGLDPDHDLRMGFALPYPEMAAAIASGKIRYAVLPEPYSTLALLAEPSLRSPLDLGALWQESTGQDSYPMTALVVSGRLAEERPDVVRALLAAVRASLEAVKADPLAAGVLVEKHDLGLKAAVAAASIPRCAFAFIPAAAARPAVEALLAVFLTVAPASVGGRLPDAAFYGRF